MQDIEPFRHAHISTQGLPERNRLAMWREIYGRCIASVDIEPIGDEPLAMAHHTIREKERLAKLSEGKCDLDDVAGVIERVVSAMALTGGDEAQAKRPSKLAAH